LKTSISGSCCQIGRAPLQKQTQLVKKLLTLRADAEVMLTLAREKHDDARRPLSDGVDPTLKRRAEEDAATNTF